MAVALVGAIEHLPNAEDFLLVVQALKGAVGIFGVKGLVAQDFGYDERFNSTIFVDQLQFLTDLQPGKLPAGKIVVRQQTDIALGGG